MKARYKARTARESLTGAHRPPGDIAFFLAVLAALVLETFWLPIYYWSTYEPCGDDRDGGLLFYGILFFLAGLILSPIRYGQVWIRMQELSPPYRIPFQAVCTILMLIVFSPLFAIVFGVLRANGRK